MDFHFIWNALIPHFYHLIINITLEHILKSLRTFAAISFAENNFRGISKSRIYAFVSGAVDANQSLLLFISAIAAVATIFPLRSFRNAAFTYPSFSRPHKRAHVLFILIPHRYTDGYIDGVCVCAHSNILDI